MALNGIRKFVETFKLSFKAFKQLSRSQQKEVTAIFGGVASTFLLGLTLLSFAGYYVVSIPLSKKNITQSYQNLIGLSSVLERMSEHLTEESSGGFDSETFSNNAEQGSSLLKEYSFQVEGLQEFLSKMPQGIASEYQNTVKSYVEKSKAVLLLEQDAVKMYESYVEPLKANEDVTIKIAGEKHYMYSEPERYQRALEEGIKQKNDVVKTLEGLQLRNEISDINVIIVRRFKSEIDYLEKMKSSLKEMDSATMSEAEQDYRRSQQQISREFTIRTAKLAEKVDTENSQLQSAQMKILSIYHRL